MARWDVFRAMRAPRAGLVDYLGTVEAETEEGAEDCAKLMFDHDDADILIEPFKPEE